MMRYLTAALTIVLLALLICAPAVAADEAPSPWFSEVEFSTIKTADALASVGTGLSVAVYRLEPDRSIWLDLAPLYDAPRDVVGGFAGVSTEIAGLGVIETMLAPLGADCVGYGGKYDGSTLESIIYCTWHF